MKRRRERTKEKQQRKEREERRETKGGRKGDGGRSEQREREQQRLIKCTSNVRYKQAVAAIACFMLNSPAVNKTQKITVTSPTFELYSLLCILLPTIMSAYHNFAREISTICSSLVE